MLNTVVIIITVVLSLIGIGGGVWSIISTRNKYYKDYMRRKRNERD